MQADVIEPRKQRIQVPTSTLGTGGVRPFFSAGHQPSTGGVQAAGSKPLFAKTSSDPALRARTKAGFSCAAPRTTVTEKVGVAVPPR